MPYCMHDIGFTLGYIIFNLSINIDLKFFFVLVSMIHINSMMNSLILCLMIIIFYLRKTKNKKLNYFKKYDYTERLYRRNFHRFMILISTAIYSTKLMRDK